VAVRDAKTQRLLADLFAIDAQLVPDTGFALRRVLGEEIAAAAEREPAKAVRALRPYMVVQASSAALAAIGLAGAADRVVETAERIDAAVVLQAGGTAFGHDRLSELATLAEAIRMRRPGLRVHVQRERHFLVQAAVIAGAAVWVGTSLHGRIAAISMRVPAVSLKNPKVKATVETWESELLPYEVAWDGLGEAVAAATAIPSAALEGLAARLEEKVVSGLERVRALAAAKAGDAGEAVSAGPDEAMLFSLAEENRHLREQNIRLLAELDAARRTTPLRARIGRRLLPPIRRATTWRRAAFLRALVRSLVRR